MIAQNDIDRLRTWAVGQPSIAELYAYGSRVAGTERDDSDLDIAVTLDLPNHQLHANWFQHYVAWERELSHLMGYTVQLIALNDDIRPPDHDPQRYEASPKVLVHRKTR